MAGRSMRVGGGGRFQKGKQELEGKGYSPQSADKIMAVRGREKYGKQKMAEMSAAGRKRAAAAKKGK